MFSLKWCWADFHQNWFKFASMNGSWKPIEVFWTSIKMYPPKWPVWKDFSINTPNLETCIKWYAMGNELVRTKAPVWGQGLCNNRILNLTVKFNFVCALWGASYLWASLLVVKYGVLINHMSWIHGSPTHDFSCINKYIMSSIGVISVYFPNYKVKKLPWIEFIWDTQRKHLFF